MTELANKIRRIPPKNTDCMLIQVRNIRYQGRSILGARTGGTPPAKPGSPRVNFPTVMGSIVSVVWARHLGGTRHPRVLLASRSHFSALGVSNVARTRPPSSTSFGAIVPSRVFRVPHRPRPRRRPPRRVVDAISLGARASDASPTRTTSVASHARTPSARRALDRPSDLPLLSSSARRRWTLSSSPRAARSTQVLRWLQEGKGDALSSLRRLRQGVRRRGPRRHLPRRHRRHLLRRRREDQRPPG